MRAEERRQGLGQRTYEQTEKQMLHLPQINSRFPLTRSAKLPYLLVNLFSQKLLSSKHLFITCVLTVRQVIHMCLSWTTRPILWGFACCSESGPHRWCSASVHSRLKTKASLRLSFFHLQSFVASCASHFGLLMLWHLGCHRKGMW